MTTGERRDQHRGWELRNKEVLQRHLADDIVGPAQLDPSVFGAVGNITTIDPDDAAAAGASGLVADAAHQHAFTSGAPSTLTRTSSNSEGSSSSHARADHGHSTANLAWGILNPGRFSSTSNNGPHSADATSDFSIASVVTDSSRLYRVCLKTVFLLDAAGVWRINLHAGGTLVDTMYLIDETVAHRDTIYTSILWEPSSTTQTIDIRVDEQAGTSSLTFEADSTAIRRFWIEDIGPR